MDAKPRGRRKFLKEGAALAGLAHRGSSVRERPDARLPAAGCRGSRRTTPEELAKELIAYGERSRFVTSMRVPVAERHSPDMFGLTFHVLTPLQDRSGSSRHPRSSTWRPTAASLFRTSIPASIV